MVHVRPSLHDEPMTPGMFGQLSLMLQMPSPSLSGSAVPMQLPLMHCSLMVHGLLSLHAPAVFCCTQPRFSTHVDVVHGLPSSLHTTGVPTH